MVVKSIKLLFLQGMKIFYFIWLVVFSVGVFAQDNVLYVSDQEADSLQYRQTDKLSLQDIQTKKKPKFNISFGTNFASNFGGANYFGTFVSPHISYPVSNRFTLRVGGTFTSPLGGTFNEPYANSFTNYYVGNLNRSFVYAEGAYQLNERVMLTGAVYKEIDLTRNPFPNNQAVSYDNKGMILGIDYKLGENVFIRGQVEISNGQNPYYYSPLGFPGAGHLSDPFFFPGGMR